MIAVPSVYKPHAWGMDFRRRRGRKTVSMHSDDHDEEDLPDIAFGVTEVPWKVAAVGSSPDT